MNIGMVTPEMQGRQLFDKIMYKRQIELILCSEK